MSDPVVLLLALVLTVAICVALFYVRRGIQSQTWRDFLGITMAFVVLVLAMLTMIVGEHSLG